MIGAVADRNAALGWFFRILMGAFSVLGVLRYGAGFYAWRAAEQLERPVYTLVQRLSNGVELRRYEPYLIAETTVEKAGFRESTGDGFRTCAGYIFGKNKPKRGGGDSETMAMTAPVRVSGQTTDGESMAMTAPVRVNGGTGKTKVSFVIGSKYNLQSAPRPLDRNIRLRNVPSHHLAVRKFSGPPPSDDRVKLERKRIDSSLSDSGIRPVTDKETLVYGYHDPVVTPNFLRRNEVAVMVDSSTVTETTSK
eukprot:CAMPEP_0198295532 /NCGR_PEP_ID=MMETSP1449-20131203/28151_1 /TAXON_ID=420275 /ORGANISM="Attheya septentrionalis, Strain CCMP2084" /LENGTH=250 /DNA_ID=CAMNT_0043995873 /DNA_START=69 /DNA_END=821 /DNA_ORIENTATION=-